MDCAKENCMRVGGRGLAERNYYCVFMNVCVYALRVREVIPLS